MVISVTIQRRGIDLLRYLLVTGGFHNPLALVVLQAGIVPGHADVFKNLAGGAFLVGNQVLVVHFHILDADFSVMLQHVHHLFVVLCGAFQAGCIAMS